MSVNRYAGWKQRPRRISRGAAILTLIGMLFLGTVFTIGMQYWNRGIGRTDAIPLSAVYDFYDVQRSQHSIRYIQLHMQGKEGTPCIDGSCVTDDLTSLLDTVPVGAELSMLLHPNSETVLELIAGDHIILSFEESQQKLAREAAGFQYLRWFLYAGAMVSGIQLIRGWKKDTSGYETTNDSMTYSEV